MLLKCFSGKCENTIISYTSFYITSNIYESFKEDQCRVNVHKYVNKHNSVIRVCRGAVLEWSNQFMFIHIEHTNSYFIIFFFHLCDWNFNSCIPFTIVDDKNCVWCIWEPIYLDTGETIAFIFYSHH